MVPQVGSGTKPRQDEETQPRPLARRAEAHAEPRRAAADAAPAAVRHTAEPVAEPAAAPAAEPAAGPAAALAAAVPAARKIARQPGAIDGSKTRSAGEAPLGKRRRVRRGLGRGAQPQGARVQRRILHAIRSQHAHRALRALAPKVHRLACRGLTLAVAASGRRRRRASAGAGGVRSFAPKCALGALTLTEVGPRPAVGLNSTKRGLELAKSRAILNRGWEICGPTRAQFDAVSESACEQFD